MTNGAHAAPVHDPAETFLVLRDLQPGFEGPSIEAGPGLSVERISPELIHALEQRGLHNAADVIGGNRLLIRVQGTTATVDLLRATSLAMGLLLATDVNVVRHATIISETTEGNPLATTTATDHPQTLFGTWGHARNELTLEDIQEAAPLTPQISSVYLTDKFHRVGNALMFYEKGQGTHDPDLALLAFTTCLEGLFSTVSQEISFQLSFRVANFLGIDENRREYFDTCREIYKIRSKITHGSYVHKENEQAAIYLVDSILPQAEGLARESLCKIFSRGLLPVFQNPQRTNVLFQEMLFGDSLDEALGRMGIS